MRYPIIISFLLIASIASAQKNNDLKTLATWMTGEFSSAEQARKDSSFFDIRLKVVPIWTNREDGIWLYVEQAAAETIDKPYRQRVYHLRENGNQLQSVIYSLPKPLRFAGKPELVQQLPIDSLATRIGCEVNLKRTNKTTFEGGTEEKKCTSELRGATYATTQVTIQSDLMISWDRGYDAADKQVWGAVKGGYIFKKQN